MIRKLQRKDVPVCHELQNQHHFHSDKGVWSLEKWYHLWEFLTDSWVYVDENDVPWLYDWSYSPCRDFEW